VLVGGERGVGFRCSDFILGDSFVYGICREYTNLPFQID